jgi:hypothetical protein
MGQDNRQWWADKELKGQVYDYSEFCSCICIRTLKASGHRKETGTSLIKEWSLNGVSGTFVPQCRILIRNVKLLRDFRPTEMFP